MTAEIANGWMPTLFIPAKAREVWGRALNQGAAKRDPRLGPLQITAGGLLAIGEGDSATAIRESLRPSVALYLGGMGAKGKNFYNNLAIRYGFEVEARMNQDLYLAGRKDEAAAVVPARLLELTSLCGPNSYVTKRIAAFKEARATCQSDRQRSHCHRMKSDRLVVHTRTAVSLRVLE